MFYEESSIGKLLKCQQCNQKFDVYDSPRILPCGKSICNSCNLKIEKQSIDKKFKCLLCSTEHYLPDTGLIKNELAFNLIITEPKEVYRSEQCETLKLNLKTLQNLVNELAFDMNNGADRIKYHCAELIRLVQLSTEQKIQQITENNESLIKQIETYERERIEEYKTTDDEYKNGLHLTIDKTNRFLIDKSAYIAQCQINEEELKKSNEISQELISKLEDHLEKYKIQIFNDSLMEFEMNKNRLEEEFLGIISLKRMNSSCSIAYSGSFDKTIKAWDLNNGECFKTLTGHTDNVLCMNILSSNKIISGSGEGTLKIWNLDTNECIKTIQAHSKRIRFIQVISDRIISCSDDKTIKTWDATIGNCIRTLEGHSSEIYCVDKLSNDKLISCSNDKTIRLWDLNTAESLKIFTGHEGPVYHVQRLSNDKIISASDDRTIKIWDLNTGECLKTLKGHTNWVWCLKVLTKDQIISGSGDKTIKIWDLNTGFCLKTLSGHFGSVRCLYRISNDKIISCSDDKLIKIWDINSGDCLKTIRGHGDIVWCLELPR